MSQAAESEIVRTYALKAIDQEIAELRPRLDRLCELSVKLHASNGNGHGRLAGVGPVSTLPLSARSGAYVPGRPTTVAAGAEAEEAEIDGRGAQTDLRGADGAMGATTG